MTRWAVAICGAGALGVLLACPAHALTITLDPGGPGLVGQTETFRVGRTSDAVGPVTFLWQFGDGESAPAALDVNGRTPRSGIRRAIKQSAAKMPGRLTPSPSRSIVGDDSPETLVSGKARAHRRNRLPAPGIASPTKLSCQRVRSCSATSSPGVAPNRSRTS